MIFLSWFYFLLTDFDYFGAEMYIFFFLCCVESFVFPEGVGDSVIGGTEGELLFYSEHYRKIIAE